MNSNRIKRLINEYLDGEIGLADKAKLEQIMEEYPRVRDEYERLRRMGSLMGLMPEVRVHPFKFRAKLNAAMDNSQRTYLTPQRAFSAAMLVVAVVFVLTFGLYAYQQQVINRSGYVPTPATASEREASMPTPTTTSYIMQTGVGAEQFFSRLALEHHLGMLDSRLLITVMSQTRVYEGATCNEGASLAPLHFPARLPSSVSLVVTPDQLSKLAGVAEELSGHPASIAVNDKSTPLSAKQLSHQGAGNLLVELQFN